MEKSSKSVIKARSFPKCPLCSGSGKPLYQNLKDRLFGVPGSWNFDQCMNKNCMALWLNPMPLEEDLPNAYVNYFTHKSLPIRDTMLRRLYRKAKRGYFSSQFDYYTKNTSKFERIIGKLIYLNPGRRADLDFEVFYLPAKKNGRLLEVGCGSGAMLKSMAEKGWDVEGVDFDPSAVNNAISKGLKVQLGSLESCRYVSNSFDAIVMSHVIEHIPDPVSLLKECERILKPGGYIVSITPNTESYGHKYFTKNWLNLDPPRHLILYNSQNMHNLVSKCNFDEITLKSTIRFANGVFATSRKINDTSFGDMSEKGNIWIRCWAKIMQFYEWWLLKFNPMAGEEIVLIAKKLNKDKDKN